MTFKQLFSQANFKISHDADFCIVVTDDISHYLLYRFSSELNCYALGFFQDVTINDLKFLYNINDGGEEDEEEYVLENIISKEKALSYIFSLIDFNNEDKSIRNPFKKDIYSKKDSNDFALVLKSVDKKPKTANILTFNKGGFHTLFANNNCIWKSGGEEQNKAVIAWNPYSLHCFFIESGKSYSSYILATGCDNYSLRSPLLGKYQEYSIICSSLSDSVEAMRFIVLMINSIAGMSFSLHHSSTMMEIEIPLAPNEEVLAWLQICSDIMKKIRNVYYESHQTNFEYIKKNKQTVLGREYLYLSFVKTQPLITFFCHYLIKKYQLNINIINAM